MNITIPDEIAKVTGLSEKQLIDELAISLYSNGKITLGHACKLTGLPELEMQKLLASRNINIKYDESEIDSDIDTIKGLDDL